MARLASKNDRSRRKRLETVLPLAEASDDCTERNLRTRSDDAGDRWPIAFPNPLDTKSGLTGKRRVLRRRVCRSDNLIGSILQADAERIAARA
jgi:hypothetical protein